MYINTHKNFTKYVGSITGMVWYFGMTFAKNRTWSLLIVNWYQYNWFVWNDFCWRTAYGKVNEVHSTITLTYHTLVLKSLMCIYCHMKLNMKWCIYYNIIISTLHFVPIPLCMWFKKINPTLHSVLLLLFVKDVTITQ